MSDDYDGNGKVAEYYCDGCHQYVLYNKETGEWYAGGQILYSSSSSAHAKEVYHPAVSAYWDSGVTTTESGWGDCPGNSNNGSTDISYSNIVYQYYPNCGHANGQILNITINLD